VVGILKGFVGLSGAIWTQIIAMINLPDQASLIFIIAVGPAMVSLTFMFIIRPVHTFNQSKPSNESGFMFIYSICLLLAAYLMGVLLLENMFDLDQNIITLFAVILIVFILLPIIVPIILVFFSKPKSADEEQLVQPSIVAATTPMHNEISDNVISKHVTFEDEKPQKNGPHRGEDFTLTQAMVNTDFWIMFVSIVLGCGSGLTMINNMGQICQSLGDNNVNIYVSVISISNFLGRVGGGYFSEVIVRCDLCNLFSSSLFYFETKISPIP